jgi:hypothetical protein
VGFENFATLLNLTSAKEPVMKTKHFFPSGVSHSRRRFKLIQFLCADASFGRKYLRNGKKRRVTVKNIWIADM